MRLRYILFFYLIAITDLKAQDFDPLFEPGAEYTLHLNDGTTLTGIVMEFQGGIVLLRTITGDFRVHVKDIKRIKGGPEKTSDLNEKWFATPKKGTYVLGPSGLPLDPNEFDYQNNYILINTLNYGITKAVSIGGGVELISAALGHPMYYLNPRIAVPLKQNFHVGGGIMFISAPTIELDNMNSTLNSKRYDVKKYYDLGVLYGSATLGSSDRNITVIAGYGLLNSKAPNRPMISVSGVYRVGSRIALVSENWLLPKYYILSYGMRLITRRIAFDFTFINNHEFYENGTFGIGIPFVSMMIRIGKLKEEPGS